MKRTRRSIAEINIVPYIDVMLVLLVIFMITAPLLTQGVQVNLPKTQAKPLSSKGPEPIIVSVNAKGLYFLNISSRATKPIAEGNLFRDVRSALLVARQKNEKRLVLVKGDKDVDYGKVVQAMVLLQRAGAPNVGLITQNVKTRIKE